MVLGVRCYLYDIRVTSMVMQFDMHTLQGW